MGGNLDRTELPLGFSFALALNPEAMKNFSNMTQENQSEVLQRARSVSSKGEMQSLVNELAMH